LKQVALFQPEAGHVQARAIDTGMCGFILSLVFQVEFWNAATDQNRHVQFTAAAANDACFAAFVAH
jgi:hypothetical protein